MLFYGLLCTFVTTHYVTKFQMQLVFHKTVNAIRHMKKQFPLIVSLVFIRNNRISFESERSCFQEIIDHVLMLSHGKRNSSTSNESDRSLEDVRLLISHLCITLYLKHKLLFHKDLPCLYSNHDEMNPQEYIVFVLLIERNVFFLTT